MALPTDNIRRYFTESCRTITSHAIITDGITDGYYPSVIKCRWHYPQKISVGISQSTITSHAIITDGISVGNSVGNYRLNFRRIYSVGNVPARNFFFLARAYPSVRPSVFCRRVFFFICDRISDGNGIYRRLVYRRTCSVGDAVGICFTDGLHCCHRRN